MDKFGDYGFYNAPISIDPNYISSNRFVDKM